MNVPSKNHRPSPVQSVRVSQGSRSDAKPAEEPRFETFEDEYQWLLQHLQEIELDLPHYNKAAMSRTQARIRQEHKNNPERGLREWLHVRDQLDREKTCLVSKKTELVARIQQIKPKVRQERRDDCLAADGELIGPDGRVNYGTAIVQVLAELRAIRKILERAYPEQKAAQKHGTNGERAA